VGACTPRRRTRSASRGVCAAGDAARRRDRHGLRRPRLSKLGEHPQLNGRYTHEFPKVAETDGRSPTGCAALGRRGRRSVESDEREERASCSTPGGPERVNARVWEPAKQDRRQRPRPSRPDQRGFQVGRL
jgi:hypothetical protein